MTLSSAYTRLRLFRQSFEDGEIDEESGLSTEDLDMILAAGDQQSEGIPIYRTEQGPTETFEGKRKG